MLSLGVSSYDNVFSSTQENVEIIPAYSQDNIDDFFAGIDVLLFPTQWKESFGLTVQGGHRQRCLGDCNCSGRGYGRRSLRVSMGKLFPSTTEGERLRSAVAQRGKQVSIDRNWGGQWPGKMRILLGLKTKPISWQIYSLKHSIGGTTLISVGF